MTEIGEYNYVFSMNGTFGTLWSNEPKGGMNKQIQYDANQLNFHYHSEHTIKGKKYALELEIIHDVRQFIVSYLIGYIQQIALLLWQERNRISVFRNCTKGRHYILRLVRHSK